MIIKSIASSSKGNCYYICDGVSHLLLEAGTTLDKIRDANIDLVQLDGCLITHSHKDHAKFARDVARYTRVYSSQQTIDKIDFGRLDYNKRIIEPKKSFEIGTFKITAYLGYHENSDGTPCEVLMYFIQSKKTKENVFLGTDSSFFVPIKVPVHYLLVECNYSIKILQKGRDVFESKLDQHEYMRLRKSHTGLEGLLEWLKNDVYMSDLREIYLTHLSDRNSDEKLFKGEVMKATGKVVYVCES